MWFIYVMMKKEPVICGIVAIGPNNVIGRGGVMPWHCRQDLYVFKKLTMGFPCVFGKTTYENLPIKPLPGRLNVVCSRSYKTEQKDNVLYVPSLEEAIKQCGNVERIFVCGGAILYKYALDNDLIDIMYITRISNNFLKSQIKQNPKEYTYFNYEFNRSKWLVQRLNYSTRLFNLPKGNPGTRATFYKYQRLR